mmetsp:Transcript_897/g.2607  ORF Transcript_897/g.2607 Transcript_897/m.2607 type:complete len:251 (+) Transcript_897:3800-4552(+)
MATSYPCKVEFRRDLKRCPLTVCWWQRWWLLNGNQVPRISLVAIVAEFPACTVVRDVGVTLRQQRDAVEAVNFVPLTVLSLSIFTLDGIRPFLLLQSHHHVGVPIRGPDVGQGRQILPVGGRPDRLRSVSGGLYTPYRTFLPLPEGNCLPAFARDERYRRRAFAVPVRRPILTETALDPEFPVVYAPELNISVFGIPFDDFPSLALVSCFRREHAGGSGSKHPNHARHVQGAFHHRCLVAPRIRRQCVCC